MADDSQSIEILFLVYSLALKTKYFFIKTSGYFRNLSFTTSVFHIIDVIFKFSDTSNSDLIHFTNTVFFVSQNLGDGLNSFILAILNLCC